MLSESNHIYTNKGIYSIYDLYTLKTSNTLDTIKVMSFDFTNLTYVFKDVKDVIYSDNTEYNIYELEFYDVYSDKVSIVNATIDSIIYRYNILKLDDDYLDTKRVKVNQYLNIVNNNPILADNLHLGPVVVDTLIDFSVKMPNISLGDTVIKFSCKVFKQKEPVYRIIGIDDNDIPIFVGQAVNAFYNFVLVK